jgi:hypothetical protein
LGTKTETDYEQEEAQAEEEEEEEEMKEVCVLYSWFQQPLQLRSAEKE